ncbi:3-deoxy-D-manno-octulosonic acid transferase [Maribacter polysiphoniae]|uniref:3-deoxy-D-manno-octulosonic acid transferase n=1 Tax=Maribacter polysiphoniae TaxID=429344 RepID=A0A316E3C5_9FLAO|nr:glycosyltransferase N-terminal domain-containing protein [Maribacter polysiphoniae]MBD1259647.1 3-deoxy-D-manno-octulosonic acid transferase [Maribacter polysiphoniae]PWK23213.1 3-deoxy-D-manno-octulosonic-acid transferase [Maribacter polysiphoniae]
MNHIYNLIAQITWFFLKIVAFFHPKIKLFVQGRKDTFPILQKTIDKKKDVIWFHVASLGEFEQGLPVMEKIKAEYPTYQILISFFSPSGYEVKKNTPVADAVIYLPIDTLDNAKRFIATVNPKLAIFVKYEIWPNYLKVLGDNNIPTVLISAIFRKDQIFFKWYGGIMRKALDTFTQFFVQDEKSVNLLKGIGLNNITLSGDTRFDRVAEILERDNKLPFMEQFKGTSPCFVAGSTWPEDEAIMLPFINETQSPLKFVLAPHNIKPEHITDLKKSITKKTLLYSEWENNDPSQFDVLIIDTIGLLTKIYSYSNIAYVGGAFATGLHNTLEPAVFGIPIIIGPDFSKFNEAKALVLKKGILVIKDRAEFDTTITQLLENPDYLRKTGQVNADYVNGNKGASIQIMAYVRTLL